jgi:putative heme-binding domain-containing protein
VRTEDKAELLKQAAAADGPSRLRALALMCRHADLFSKEERLAAVKVNWNDNDRSLRQACAELLRTIEVKERFELSKALKPNEWAYYTALHACVTDMGAGFSVALPAAEKERIKTPQDVEMSLATLRLIQLHFGDIGDPKKKGTVWEGYSARLSNEQRWQRLGGGELVRISWFVASLHDFVLPFLQHDEMLAILRECSRVWSMMDLDDVIKDVSMNYAAVAKKCKNPTDSLHFLIAFGADPKGNNNPTALGAAVDILLGLNPRLEKLGAQRDLHWQPRLGELHLTLSDKYPAFNDLMLKHPNFVRADHVFFTKTPGFDRKKAASLFLKKVETESTFSWNADLVALLAELPAEQSLPVLRQQWGKSGVDAALLPILARTPQPEDRPKFVEGLASSNLATVSECLEALDKLPAKKDVAETGALIRALQTLPDAKEGQGLRKWVAERLKNTTGQDLGLDGAAWLKWFAGVEPKLAARLTNPDGVDVEAWSRRFAKLEWDNGDAGRGKAVFVKANCSTCHSGAAALGPDLSGITGRFSRPDLFTAIVQPSRDVADRYRTTVIETAAGKTYQGVVAYEAVDSLILHTGPATTVRIAGNEIASRKISRISLMPAGLLDGLLDREIVDLYAYLKTNPLK